ncbi:hypothetical protein ABIA30_005205 [Mycobacterium sp. MAA66]
MTIPAIVGRVVGFLRAGYPDGVPTTDYVPLFALLRRRLSEDEVRAVADQLHTPEPVDITDIEVAITKALDALPFPRTSTASGSG